MSSAEDEAGVRYEIAEEAFLAAIRAGQGRSTLRSLADAVALRATEWNSVAYSAFHASSGEQRAELDHLTERTEVLAELWSDIAGALRDREALRDG